MAEETKSSESTGSKTSSKASTRTAEEQQREEEQLSKQAHFSTYSEDPDVPETNPPTGRSVVQERGKPSEGEVDPAIKP